MKLLSPAFQQGGKIPRKYTCQGDELNPPLEISDVPKEAISLVLLMDDPDVPEWVRKEKMYDHWVVFNIDPKVTKIAENSPPFGILGVNTGGRNAYAGPCPPDREHRYFFKLFALDNKLDLKAGATKNEVLNAMGGHVIADCELMATYVKT